uniref:Uncharacterized protein n=2 Tax=Anguilla anguilla TaxID=7936 RepID=A0A0E9QB56_ANGAN
MYSMIPNYNHQIIRLKWTSKTACEMQPKLSHIDVFGVPYTPLMRSYRRLMINVQHWSA